MEILKYSKEALARDYADCHKLDEVIRALENSAQQNGQVICQVKVNGLKLSEADELRLAETRLEDIREIEVQLSKQDNVLNDSVRALQEYLIAFQKRVVSAAEQFRKNARQPMSHLFSEIVQSTQLLTDALLALKPLLIAQSRNSAEYAVLWQATEKHFMQTVQELALAYDGQDFVLVSDVLEYELHNSIEKWIEIIRIDC